MSTAFIPASISPGSFQMCSCLSSTFVWSQHLIVSSPVYTTRKPKLILTWITAGNGLLIIHHLTLPIVRIPSLTVSFSVYDASAVRRMILKTRARKWQAFSEAVSILLSFKCGSAIVRMSISYPSWRHYFRAFRCGLCSTHHRSGVDVPTCELSGQKYHD